MYDSVFNLPKSEAVVLSSPGPTRQMIVDILAQSGIENIHLAKNTNDIYDITRQLDTLWVLVNTQSDVASVLQELLSYARKQISQKQIYVSAILTPNQTNELEALYSAGLLCSFTAPFNRASLESEIQALLSMHGGGGFSPVKTSSRYLLQHLEIHNQMGKQITFLERFLELYPEDFFFVEQLLSMYLSNKIDHKAISLYDLYEATVPKIRQDFYQKIEDLRKPDESRKTSLHNYLHRVRSCLVIDPDATSRKTAVRYLKQLGFGSVLEFHDGVEALHWTQDHQPDLIIQEWKLPKLSGAAFLQRVIDLWPNCHFILTSSLVNQGDQALLDELGVYTTIQKPLTEDRFLGQVLSFLKWLNEDLESTSLRKLRGALNKENISEAERIRDKAKQSSSFSTSLSTLMNAEILYARKDYVGVVSIIKNRVETNKHQLRLLDLLGKSLLKLGDYETALICFEKAQTHSSMNISRVCTLSEIHSTLGHDLKADTLLEFAEKLDQNAPLVVETKARIAFSRGKVAEAISNLQDLSLFEKLVPSLNNYAVSLAKSGHVEKSLQVYQEGLDALQPHKVEEEAIIRYNYALAYLRRSMLDYAALQLTTAISLGLTKVHGKCRKLLSKISKAQKTGGQLRLSAAETGDTEESSVAKGVELPRFETRELDEFLIEPGQYCCHKIF